MIKSEKKLARFAELLNKKNSTLISHAINTLRDEEPFEGAIGLLASLYDRTDDAAIQKAIELFMNDLKDPGLRTEMVTEIKKSLKDRTKCMLVASCWQSGQDYSDYSEDFAEFFLAGDYATAIECYTVITEAEDNISKEKKDKIITRLETGSSTTNEKSALISDLISRLA